MQYVAICLLHVAVLSCVATPVILSKEDTGYVNRLKIHLSIICLQVLQPEISKISIISGYTVMQK